MKPSRIASFSKPVIDRGIFMRFGNRSGQHQPAQPEISSAQLSPEAPPPSSDDPQTSRWRQPTWKSRLPRRLFELLVIGGTLLSGINANPAHRPYIRDSSPYRSPALNIAVEGIGVAAFALWLQVLMNNRGMVVAHMVGRALAERHNAQKHGFPLIANPSTTSITTRAS